MSRIPEIKELEINSRKEINAGDSLDPDVNKFFMESTEYLSEY